MRRLESQKVAKKGIFGGGAIVSDAVAEQLARAEQLALAEQLARAVNTIEWSISDAERVA